MARRLNITLLLNYLIMVISSLIILIPLSIMIFTSLKGNKDYFLSPLSWPNKLHWENYAAAWFRGEFPQHLFNSLFVTSTAVLIIVLGGAMASYAISRVKVGRWNGLVFAILLAGLILPGQVGLIPLFMLLRNLGLFQHNWGVILIFVAQGLSITVFIYTKFFNQIPFELEEAATMDGSSKMRTFWSIILPLSLPATATIIILNTLVIWNDFFNALIFIGDSSNQTLPLGLISFKAQGTQTDWPELFAYSTLIAAPILIFYLFLQRYLISGLTDGAVKG